MQRLTALDGKRRFALAAAASHKEEVGRLRFVSTQVMLSHSWAAGEPLRVLPHNLESISILAPIFILCYDPLVFLISGIYFLNYRFRYCSHKIETFSTMTQFAAILPKPLLMAGINL